MKSFIAPPPCRPASTLPHLSRNLQTPRGLLGLSKQMKKLCLTINEPKGE
jgi:hypothetical protein